MKGRGLRASSPLVALQRKVLRALTKGNTDERAAIYARTMGCV
jgi:hypothetical protein